MTIHTKAPQSIDEKIDRILGLGGGVVGGTEVIISIDVYNKRVEKIKELFRAEITTTDMEVSEIEELVEEFERNHPGTMRSLMGLEVKDFLRQALTQAYQAGIDEAVEKLAERVRQGRFAKVANDEWNDENTFGYREALKDIAEYLESEQALDDTIKALETKIKDDE